MARRPSVPEAEWLDRFSLHVRLLLLHLDPAEADECAREIFAEAAHLSPEMAADIYAAEGQPGAAGQPRPDDE